MPEMLCKMRSTFIKLDFPDPVEHWPEMLACVAFAGLMGAVLVAGCVVAGVV